MTNETITVHDGARNLRPLATRAWGLDEQAVARMRRVNNDHVDVFFTTPFDILASRRVEAEISRDGAVVPASVLAELPDVVVENPEEVDLGPACDALWPGALPPVDNFAVLERLPVAVVRKLADDGQNLARQFSGPMGPPASLLNQTVISVENGPSKVEAPMRMIFACTSLGLIPDVSAPADIPRHLRVSVCGRWLRIDAPYGTVYRSSSLLG